MFGLLKYLYFCRRIKNNKNFTTMKKKSNLKKEWKGVQKLTPEEMRAINGGGFIWVQNEKREWEAIYVED